MVNVTIYSIWVWDDVYHDPYMDSNRRDPWLIDGVSRVCFFYPTTQRIPAVIALNNSVKYNGCTFII